MSLIITVNVPEAIVMASDSRQSILVEAKTPEGKDLRIETTNSDAVSKTHLLESQQVGLSNFGQDLLNGIPMSSYVRKFIEEEIVAADDITTIPSKLTNYFKSRFPKADVGFHVAGYVKEKKLSVPHFYVCHISSGSVERRNLKPDGSIAYGATWSGQIDVITSIFSPIKMKDDKGQEQIVKAPPAPVVWDAMSIQDAIDFSIYAIRTTIDTIRFQARPKNVGGPIDVLLLTPDGKSRWIQRKDYHC